MPPPAEGRDQGASSLAAAAARCRADAGFLEALRTLYAAVDAAVAARGWHCKACGACCDFTSSGHRLYVSTGELALLTSAAPPQALAAGRCPYQIDGRCTVREARALGCRLFFCDPAAREVFQQDYETYHRQLRRLHQAAGLPYRYVELTAAMEELFGTESH
jgi:Fe-S-cluster containining protein